MKPVIGKFKNSAIPQECWGCSNQQPQQEQKQEQQMPPTPLPPMFQPPKKHDYSKFLRRVACKFAVDLPTSTSPNVQLAVRLQVGVVGVVNGELSRIRKIKMDQNLLKQSMYMYGIFTYMFSLILYGRCR